MSSIIQAPPPTITLDGPDGPGPHGVQIGSRSEALHGQIAGLGNPDDSEVVVHLKIALTHITQAAQLEGDDQDAAKYMKIAALLHAAVADHQKLTDTAMGAGPGARMLRKATGPPSGDLGGGPVGGTY